MRTFPKRCENEIFKSNFNAIEKEKTDKLTNETGTQHRSTSDVIGHCVANAGTDATSEMKSSIKNLSKQVKNSSAGSKFGFILLDEATRTTKFELDMFLATFLELMDSMTRLGILGDPCQVKPSLRTQKRDPKLAHQLQHQ